MSPDGFVLAVVNLVHGLTRGNVANELGELDRIAGTFDALLSHCVENIRSRVLDWA